MSPSLDLELNLSLWMMNGERVCYVLNFGDPLALEKFSFWTSCKPIILFEGKLKRYF